jgi:UDP-N-acetylmuramyl pentapeptide synthase
VIAGVRAAGAKRAVAYAVEGNDAAARTLRSLARAGDLILLKGSRGARLEEVLRAFPED